MLFLACLASIHALPDDPRSHGDSYERDGFEPRQRHNNDENGRPIPALCPSMERGDFREHADNSQYSEKYSARGFRIGVNYVIYSMTHRGEPKI